MRRSASSRGTRRSGPITTRPIPGITLIELAAWMTDLLIHRLNQVPEKNYVAFLNLLGIKLRAPRAAKALLQFKLVEGTAVQRCRWRPRCRRRRPATTRR
jgi:hypothetical protein